MVSLPDRQNLSPYGFLWPVDVINTGIFKKNARPVAAKAQPPQGRLRLCCHNNAAAISHCKTPAARRGSSAKLLRKKHKAVNFFLFGQDKRRSKKLCSEVCQDVNDDKKSPWCIALHTIYTIIAQDDLDRAYLRMELF